MFCVSRRAPSRLFEATFGQQLAADRRHKSFQIALARVFECTGYAGVEQVNFSNRRPSNGS